MSPENDEKKRRQARGDDFLYHYSHDGADQPQRNLEVVNRELLLAIADAHSLVHELSELLHVVHGVQVSSVVQEDVLQLCHGLKEVLAGSISSRAVLSGRARARERKERRALSR